MAEEYAMIDVLARRLEMGFAGGAVRDMAGQQHPTLMERLGSA